MFTLRKISFIYLTLWCLYNVQGLLYESGGWFSQSLFLIISLFNVYFFIKCMLCENKPIYFNGLNVMFFLLMANGVYYIFINTSSAIFFLKSLSYSVLPIYAFYYLFYKNALKSEDLERWSYVFILVLIITYRVNQIMFLDNDLVDDITQITNNAGLRMITIIPFVLFVKKPLTKYVILGTSLLFTLLAMKRGAILIAFVLLIIYFRNNISFKNKKGLWTLLAGLGVVIMLFFASRNLMQNNAYFQERVDRTLEGDDSGREILWSRGKYAYLNDYSLWEQFIGKGPNGFSDAAGLGAHNDWYEFLLDFGLLSIIIYVYYWRNFFLTWRKTKNRLRKNEISDALLMIFISMFLRTLYSWSFTNLFFIETCSLGCCLAYINKQKN